MVLCGGDTKLYYASDVLKSYPWGPSRSNYNPSSTTASLQYEANNMLAITRPAAPECQAIHLTEFRQIALTVDNYLSKRAWSTEGAFSSFTSVMLGWITETKRIYEGSLYNTFIGTNYASNTSTKQVINFDIPASTTGLTGLEKDRKEALTIAQKMADLVVDMGNYTRDYNDYGFLRSYDESDIKVIWNSDYVNKIRKVDLPTIYNRDGLTDKMGEDVLPATYFGTVNTTSTTADGSTVRSMVEADYGTTHVFPGQLIPSGQVAAANKSYTVDKDVIAKVVVKYPPMMSSFEVGTSFFNPAALVESHWLTWGYNDLEHLKNYPFITIKAKQA